MHIKSIDYNYIDYHFRIYSTHELMFGTFLQQASIRACNSEISPNKFFSRSSMVKTCTDTWTRCQNTRKWAATSYKWSYNPTYNR